ncbi:MAG TPA: ABC transporter permease [Blastocatellia bacterium]
MPIKLFKDLQYAVRVLFRNPAFTVIAVVTLALGIGVNATVFSVVNAYLFKPLPVKDPGKLVAVVATSPFIEFPTQVSYPDYRDIAERTDVFTGVLGYEDNPVNMSLKGNAQRIWAELVTPNYFPVLGIDAFIGRTFTPAEARIPGANPVAILSYGFWHRQFGSDHAVLGSSINLDSVPFTIIGVAPESYRGAFPLISPDIYVPAGTRGLLFDGGDATFNVRSLGPLALIGRLKDNASVTDAQAALSVLSDQLRAQYPESNRDMSFTAIPETRSRPALEVASTFDRISVIFMVLVGLVLLIACANVTNLMLARAISRRKELAIRNALGASRTSLLRLFLVEALLLSIGGGVLGLMLGYWASRYMSTLHFSVGAPVTFNFALDIRVFLYAFGAVVVTTLISGLLPALRASRTDLVQTINEGGRGGSSDGTWNRLRGALVVAQVAVSLFLLIAGALFVRSMENAEHSNLGFRTRNVLLGSVDLSLQHYDQARGQRFFKEVIDSVDRVPGVKSATLSCIIPFGGNNAGTDITAEENTSEPKRDAVLALDNSVGPDYFSTMDVPVIEGRAFEQTDNAQSPPVAVVSQAMARVLWPDADPLGKRFKSGSSGPLIQVVGVTTDESHVFLGETPRPFFYRPVAQQYWPFAAIEVYTEGDPASFALALRAAVHELDPDLPVYDVTSMESHLRNGLAFFFVRAGAGFAAVFGFLALVLATVGVYGVVSYSVSRRGHEIAIRMALGASRAQVLSMLFRQGFVVVGIGIVIGLGLAAVGGKPLSGLLVGVGGFDLRTFVVVSALLGAIGALAIWLPALRASRAHPMSALRSE